MRYLLLSNLEIIDTQDDEHSLALRDENYIQICYPCSNETIEYENMEFRLIVFESDDLEEVERKKVEYDELPFNIKLY